MRRTTHLPRILALIALMALTTSSGQAQAPAKALTELADVHRACHEAAEGEAPQLYVMPVDEGGFRFAQYDREVGALHVDPEWNLRAMEGKVQAFARHREVVGFTSSPEEAAALQDAVNNGARLRVGFFLGVDGGAGSLCLVRPTSAVTIVRLEPAFLELVSEDGAVLARHETDRLLAFRDDAEHAAIPGEGPRGVVGEPSLPEGTLPAAWGSALARPARARGFSACYAAALERGAEPTATIILRLEVEGASGAIKDGRVELSTLGDDEANACVLRELTSGPALGRGGLRGKVSLRVPVRLAR